MRVEKQINGDMLRRCNQALDNSQDLIDFYNKLVRKVERQVQAKEEKHRSKHLGGMLSSIASGTVGFTRATIASITPEKPKSQHLQHNESRKDMTPETKPLDTSMNTSTNEIDQ